MKPLIYIETTVISYLAARPARDVVSLARQALTRDFWAWASTVYDLSCSELTRNEIARGDADAAARRHVYFGQCRLLADFPEAGELAQRLIDLNAVPKTEPEDAVHIAIATIANAKYIVSWNFAHIVSPQAKRQLEAAISALGYDSPLLVTPEELYEGEA